jgi:hypothetical protein
MDMRIPLIAISFLMALGAPATAQQLDGGALTCAEYNAMNAADKNAAMGAIRAFAKESVNATAAGMVAQMDTDDDVAYMGRMDASCINAVGTKTVIDAMQTTN